MLYTLAAVVLLPLVGASAESVEDCCCMSSHPSSTFERDAHGMRTHRAHGGAQLACTPGNWLAGLVAARLLWLPEPHQFALCLRHGPDPTLCCQPNDGHTLRHLGVLRLSPCVSYFVCICNTALGVRARQGLDGGGHSQQALPSPLCLFCHWLSLDMHLLSA